MQDACHMSLLLILASRGRLTLSNTVPRPTEQNFIKAFVQVMNSLGEKGMAVENDRQRLVQTSDPTISSSSSSSSSIV